MANCKRWNRKRSSCPSLCIAMRELCQTTPTARKWYYHHLLSNSAISLHLNTISCLHKGFFCATTAQLAQVLLYSDQPSLWTGPPPDINWLGAVALPLLDWLAPSPKLLAGVHSASSSSTPHPSENLIVLVGFVRSRSYGPPSSFFAPTAEPPRTGRTFATTIIGAWW